MPTPAKTSIIECCFTSTTEAQTMIEKNMTNNFTNKDVFLRLNHTDTIPREYATCRDGHTPVGVSTEYMNRIKSQNTLSPKTSGLPVCIVGYTK